MGISGAEECRRAELEELRRISERACMLSSRRKDSDDFLGRRVPSNSSTDSDEEAGDELVCVTSGASLLGLAVVNRLLLRGFSVRIVLDNPEDKEKVLGEMKLEGGGVGIIEGKVGIVSANLRESESLAIAFEGCRGVFHTSSFIDPSGLTGYSKAMAELEKNVSENVMEACARSSSVRYCVFTSSLLACIWRDPSRTDLPHVVDHDSWSDQSLCIHKKLWFALGKLKAEKAAWRIAKERDLKLVTICPGFITAPDLSMRNPTPTIAYLKGAEEMYKQGLLATVSVRRLAEAHVRVYEAMGENEAHGRYICYDEIIKTEAEAEAFAREICVPVTKICKPQEEASTSNSSKFQLSNKRLYNLISARAPPSCLFSKQA